MVDFYDTDPPLVRTGQGDFTRDYTPELNPKRERGPTLPLGAFLAVFLFGVATGALVTLLTIGPSVLAWVRSHQ